MVLCISKAPDLTSPLQVSPGETCKEGFRLEGLLLLKIYRL